MFIIVDCVSISMMPWLY